MTRNDLYEAGDQIKQLVQDAIDSKDFSNLSDTITNVVDQTMDGLQAALREGLNSAQHRTYQRTNSEAAERIRREMEEKRKERLKASRNKTKMKNALVVPGEIAGRVKQWFGFSLSGMCGFTLAILGIVGVTTGISLWLPAGIMALLTGVGAWMGIDGKRKFGLARRFRRYMDILGERTFCLIEELASAVGKSTDFVRKDLKKMLDRGYFKHGHLDGRESMLITDDEVYRQYLSTQTEYERRRMNEYTEAASASDAKNMSEQEAENLKKLSPECRAIIEEGQRYIQHIHLCNQRIPDANMSAKLDRLELVITKIFREVEKNPSTAGDLRKMMSYYLPTTQKLLDTYCEMDAQQIRGQNIEGTKQEIENALDTISAAFENLLDSFFQDTAWDISSDISVLNTMLAQEGLTSGSDFSR